MIDELETQAPHAFFFCKYSTGPFINILSKENKRKKIIEVKQMKTRRDCWNDPLDFRRKKLNLKFERNNDTVSAMPLAILIFVTTYKKDHNCNFSSPKSYLLRTNYNYTLGGGRCSACNIRLRATFCLKRTRTTKMIL